MIEIAHDLDFFEDICSLDMRTLASVFPTTANKEAKRDSNGGEERDLGEICAPLQPWDPF